MELCRILDSVAIKVVNPGIRFLLLFCIEQVKRMCDVNGVKQRVIFRSVQELLLRRVDGIPQLWSEENLSRWEDWAEEVGEMLKLN